MDRQKRSKLLLAGLLFAALWFAPLRLASAEIGKYFGYVSTRGIVLDEKGNAIWVSYTESGSYERLVPNGNGGTKPETVQIPGIQVRQYTAEGAFKDAVVIGGAEYRQHAAIFKSEKEKNSYELIRRKDFKSRIPADEQGSIDGRTLVVMARTGALPPGAKVILAQFPVYPEGRLSIAPDLGWDPYCNPRIVDTTGANAELPCRAAEENQPDLASLKLNNVLVSTQPENDMEGQVLVTSQGIIAYQMDYVTPMSIQERRSLGYTGFFSGFCNQTPLVPLTVTSATGEQSTYTIEDYKTRFMNCDARVVDTIPEPDNPQQAMAAKVWGPLPGAYVYTGAPVTSAAGAPADPNGLYVLDYFYLAGLPVKDRLAVGVVFAPHNPKVPFGSRYWTHRDVEGGPTFVSSIAMQATIYNEALDALMTPLFHPLYPTTLNAAYIVSIGGDPTYSNYLAWMAGVLIDTHQPRSYNIGIDGSYIFGEVKLENKDRGPIKLDTNVPVEIAIDNTNDRTSYSYTKPRYPQKQSVEVRYPGDGGVPTYTRYQATGGQSGAGTGGVASTDPVHEDPNVASDLVDRGLLTTISRADLQRKTDIYIFDSDGAMMHRWRGVRPSDIAGVTCEGVNKQPFGSYTGACADGQTTDCIRCSIDPQVLSNKALFNVSSYFPQKTYSNRYKILIINRVTGYVGTGYIDMTKTNDNKLNPDVIPEPGTRWAPRSGFEDHAIFAKDGTQPIIMRPPNLVIRARRATGGENAKSCKDENTPVIGLEGAGLNSDICISLETEWKDWDGSALPDLLNQYGFTGRLAGVRSNGDVLKDSFHQTFQIRPNGPYTAWLRVPLTAQNLHYYVHVSGESLDECGKEKDGWCKSFGSTRDEMDSLPYRPSYYAPFKVPVFDEDATKSAVTAAVELAKNDGSNRLGKVLPIYREVYRPEYQFTVFDLPPLEEAQTVTQINPDTGASGTSLSFGYSLTPATTDSLPPLGSGQVPIWSVGYEELVATLENAGVKPKFTNLDELLLLSPARQLQEIENIANDLEGSAFLGLQLYLDHDRGNVLYQNLTVPLILAEAKSLELTRHVNLGTFPVKSPPSIEDFRAIRFALTRKSNVRVIAWGHGATDDTRKDLYSAADLGVGVYYLLLDTEKMVGLPRSFTLELTAIATDTSGMIGPAAPIPHTVYFPVRFNTVLDGEPLGEVIEHNVNIVDGSLKLSRQDFAIEGRGPNLALARSYNNNSPASKLGPGWAHTFGYKLFPISTTEYAGDDGSGRSKPEWLAGRKMIERASDIDEARKRPDVPFDLSRLSVNGTTFVKADGEWMAEFGRHGSLESTGDRCYTDPTDPTKSDKEPDCYKYTAPDGTAYRYLAPDPESFAPVDLADQRSMINVTDGLFTRVGLDPKLLVVEAQQVAASLPKQTDVHYQPMPLRSITDKYGNRLDFHYAEDGELDTVKDAVGRVCTFAYGAFEVEEGKKCLPEKAERCQRLKSVQCLKDAAYDAQIDILFDYDVQGYLTKVTRGRRIEEYEYDPPAKKDGKADRVLVSVKQRQSPWVDQKTTYKYGTSERVFAPASGRDPVPENRMVFGVVYPATQAPDGEESVLSVQFDYLDTPRRRVNTGGMIKTYTLIGGGNPSRIEEPRGKVTTMEWSNPWADPPPVGGCKNESYADNVLLKKTVTRGDGKTLVTTYAYDSKGHLTDECGPGDQHIVQRWSENTGVLTSRTDALHGTEETWEVEATDEERVRSHTDRAGHTTTYAYDEANPGKVKTETIEESVPQRKTIYEYDGWGNLARVEIAPFETPMKRYERDARGRIKFQWDPGQQGEERQTTNTYDKNDNLTSVILPTLTPNGIVNEMDVRQAWKLTYDYDEAGNRISETDRNGVLLTHEYTPLGQVWKTTRSPGNDTRVFKYDVLGHLRQETDWDGRTTEYQYDALGFQDRVINRAGSKMYTHRDFLGNVVDSMDYGGLETRITYDDNGKEQTREIVGCDDDDCGMTVRFDPVVAGDASGGRASAKYSITRWDELGHATVEAYDGQDRLVFRSRGLGGASEEFIWRYDAAGLLQETINEEDLHTKYTYDERGFRKTMVVEHIADRGGSDVRTEYDVWDTGKIKAERRNGRDVVIEYKYDEWDRLISRQVPVLGIDYLAYDGQGNTVRHQDFDVPPNRRTWHRDALGRVLAYVDAETASSTQKKQFSSICQDSPAERSTLCYEYNRNGTVSRQVDARGVETRYTYDSEDREMTRTEEAIPWPGSETETARTRVWEVTPARDAMGNIAVLRDYDNIETTFDYTSRHLIKTKSYGSHVTTYTYTGSGRIATESSDVNDTTKYKRTFKYDDFDRLFTVTYEGDGGETATEATYTYDKVGNVLTVANRAGEVTEKKYDGLLRHEFTLQKANAGATGVPILQRHYDETKGTVDWTKDGEEKTTTYSYDDANRLRQITYPDSAISTLTYNMQGLVETETIPGGYTTSYEYDREGRVTARTLGAERYSHTYDLAGNTLTETQPEGQLVQPAGQPAGKYAGKFKEYHYDAFGRLDTVTDEEGLKTTVHSDNAGRVDDVQGPIDLKASNYTAPRVRRAYNDKGQLWTVTKDIAEGVQSVTTFSQHDGLDRAHVVERPNGTRIDLRFDKYDRPTRTDYTHPLGAPGGYEIASTERAFADTLNQVTITEHKVLPDGTAAADDVTIEQDNIGKNFTRTSQQRGAKISYTYNRRGQKASVVSDASGALDRSTGYEYDDRGRLKKVVTPKGDIGYAYDDTQRTMTVSATGRWTTTYQYNPNQRVAWIKHVLADGTETLISYAYDRNGNPTRIGDKTNEPGESPNEDVTDFGVYDAIGRLLEFSQEGKTTVYEYEGYDRKKETVRTGGGSGPIEKTRSYSYDQGRRLQQVTEDVTGVGTVHHSYAYDASGNLLSRTNDADPSDNMSFTYNARDQLVRVTRGGTVVGVYDYDSAGRRIRQRGTDRGDIDSIYDDNSILEELLVNGGQSERYRFHYGLSLLARLGTGGATTAEFYHQDLQGTTRHLSDATGARSASYKHDPWGKVRRQSGNSLNRTTYTQQQYDPASGLYYYGARFYDPQVGRFLTEDTAPGDAQNPPSLNSYLYAHSNPARFIDPTGHSAEEVNAWNPSGLGVDETPVSSHGPNYSVPSDALVNGGSGDFATASVTAEDASGRMPDAQSRRSLSGWDVAGMVGQGAVDRGLGMLGAIAGQIGSVVAGVAGGVGDFVDAAAAGDVAGMAKAAGRGMLSTARAGAGMVAGAIKGVVNLPGELIEAGERLGDAAASLKMAMADPEHNDVGAAAHALGGAITDTVVTTANAISTVVPILKAGSVAVSAVKSEIKAVASRSAKAPLAEAAAKGGAGVGKQVEGGLARGAEGAIARNVEKAAAGEGAAAAAAQGGLTPADLGLRSIASDPQWHRLWTQALKDAAKGQGGRMNDYQRLLNMFDRSAAPTGKDLSKAFSTVRGYFRRAAAESGIQVPAGDIHHWNFNKAAYPEQVFDPRNLFPTSSEIQHNSAHMLTGRTGGLDFNGPIAPEHELLIPDNGYPLPLGN